MPAFCARVDRFMISLPNTPSSSARRRSFLTNVISFSKDPIHFGFGIADDRVQRVVAVAAADRLALGERRAHVDRLVAAAIAAERIEQQRAGQAVARGVRAVEHSGGLTGADAVRIAARRLEVQDVEALDEILVVRVGHRRRST